MAQAGGGGGLYHCITTGLRRYCALGFSALLHQNHQFRKGVEQFSEFQGHPPRLPPYCLVKAAGCLSMCFFAAARSLNIEGPIGRNATLGWCYLV